MLDKKGAMKNAGLIWVILGFVILFVALRPGGFTFTTTPTDSGTGGGGGLTPSPCPNTNKVTVTNGPIKDRFAPTAAHACASSIFVNGVDQGEYASGATLDVGPGQPMDIYYCGSNMTTGGNAATSGSPSYYTNKQHINQVGCVNFNSADTAYDPTNAHLVMRHDDAITINVFNDGDNSLENLATGGSTTTTGNHTVGAGGNVRFRFVFIGSDNNVIDPDRNLYAVFEFNSTAWDSSSFAFGDWTPTTTPSFYAVNVSAYSFSTKTFKHAGSSNEFFSLTSTLSATAKSGVNPTANGTDQIGVFFLHEDWCQDTKTDVVAEKPQVEDSNGNRCGSPTANGPQGYILAVQ